MLRRKYILLLGLLMFGIPKLTHAQVNFVTGSLTAQAVACPTSPGPSSSSTSALTISTVGYGGATFTLGSSAFSATVSFFGSGDGGTTWQPLNTVASNATSAVLTATATGLFQTNVAGYTNVCMVVTTFVSGTVTARIQLSTISARAGGGVSGGGLPAAPTSPNGVSQSLTSTPSGGVAGPSTFSLPGLPTRRVTGTGTTDTIVAADCSPGVVSYQGNPTGLYLFVTLPTATTLGVPNCVFDIQNSTTNGSTVMVTPTGWTFVTPGNAANTQALLPVGPQQIVEISPDPSGSSWDYRIIGLPGTVLATNYGVIPDEIRRFDGVITNTPPTNFGNSTTATSPAITTTAANDAVINIFDSVSGNFSVNPATGTNIVSVNQAAGQYGAFVNWQTVASAGAVAAVTGTFAANQKWIAATIALKPSGTIAARTATTAQQSSGATLTLNVPASTANGDFLVACIESFSSSIEVSNSILPPAAFTYRLLAVRDAALSNSVGADKMYCYGRIASSEPASYVFTENDNTAGLTGWMEAFTNVLGVDSAPTLTSAGASFTTADVGKDICVGGSLATTTATVLQSCGTVSSVTSGTVLVCNTCYAGQGSSNEYRYGTDDTTQTQNALNAIGNIGGGTLYLPAGGMMVNAQLTLPATASVILRGTGSATANWGYQGGGVYQAGTVVNNAKIGTEIDFAATNISGACLLYSPGNNGIINNVYQDTVQDLTLWGGAGTSQDGGGSHGFEGINAQRLILRNVIIGNFIGNGALFTNASATGYTDGITFDNAWTLSNGLSGTYINSNAIAQIQNVYLQNSQFDNNSLYGLELGGAIQGFKLSASNVQRNGNGSGSQAKNLFFDNGGVIKGCSIDSNFFESDNSVGAGLIYNVTTTAQLFCQWSPQVTANIADSNFPTISSGFDAAAAVSQKNDTLPSTSVQIDVGTPASVAAGVVTLPPAPNSWSCQAGNLTAHLGNRADDTVVTAVTKTSVSVQNQTKSTGAAANWTAHDAVQINCTAF